METAGFNWHGLFLLFIAILVFVLIVLMIAGVVILIRHSVGGGERRTREKRGPGRSS